jgi:hypothetical protein
MKPPKKSAVKTVAGVPFKNGEDPRRGRGPKPGTGGRPPIEFRDRMREMASRDDVQSYLEKCIAGEFGPVFYFKALEYASDRGYGKSTQAVELTGAEGAPLFKSFMGVDTDAV